MPPPKGTLSIRLARFGRRHQPLYNIVVSNSKKARDSLPIEVLGTYNPVPVPLGPEEKAKGVKPYKDIHLDFERSKYWLGVGARTSDRVAYLFKKAGIVPQTFPRPEELTQHIQKPTVAGPKTVYEEPQSHIRPRD